MSDERNMNMYRDMAIRFCLAKSGGCCWYCGIDLTSETAVVEHVIPLGKGGTHDPDNLVPACRSCNTLKGSLSVADFRGLMTRRQVPKFNDEQRSFLKAAMGVDVYAYEPPIYEFWFERMGIDHE